MRAARPTHLLDHSLGQNLNLLLLESGYSVIDQLLAEHGQNGRQRFDERDADSPCELGVPRLEVMLMCRPS